MTARLRRREAMILPRGAAGAIIAPAPQDERDKTEGEMEEFEGGFLRNFLIGFALALLFSFAYVWFN